MAFAITKGMEKLGGHLLQFGYLTCHVASRWWMVEDEVLGCGLEEIWSHYIAPNLVSECTFMPGRVRPREITIKDEI